MRSIARALAGLLVVALVAALALPVLRALDDEGGSPPRAQDDEPPDLESLQDELDRAQRLAECAQADIPGGGLDVEAKTPRKAVSEIARVVELLRDLEFEDEVEAEFLVPDEVGSRIGDLFTESYSKSSAARDERVLKVLRAISPKTRLRGAVKQALEGQVAGFYIPETGELVVRSAAGARELSPVDQVTLSHELEHALADQLFELPIPKRARPRNADADLAALALVEGDATLTMQRFAASSLSVSEQLSLASDPEVAEQAASGLEGLSPYLQRQLLFPYIDGLSFVCALYSEGGWRAVDAAYKRPPSTSAQILFPERYLGEEEARDPVDPPSPGRGWRALPVSSFGAAPLQWLFDAPNGDPTRSLADPLEAAGAWAGGELHVWEKGDQSAFALVFVERDTPVLCTAIEDWYRAAWSVGEEHTPPSGAIFAIDNLVQTAVLACRDDQVRLTIAPRLAIARKLAR